MEKLLTQIFGSYEPTSDRTDDWGRCPRCKQSWTGQYTGKRHCTRCSGHQINLVRFKSSDVKYAKKFTRVED